MKELEKKTEEKSIETPYIVMSLQEGILYFTYKEIDNMDLDLAKTCVKDRLDFTKDKSYPCLVDFVKLKKTSKEARDYFALEGNKGITANAILVNSSAYKMMANFYIMVNKPQNPTKLFTDKNLALDWLKQFRD